MSAALLGCLSPGPLALPPAPTPALLTACLPAVCLKRDYKAICLSKIMNLGTEAEAEVEAATDK